MAHLVLPESLTHEDAAACCRMLMQAVRASADAQTVADASALVRFDSSALAVLLECRREALALGQGFRVQSMPPKLRALAGLYGVGGLLPA